MSGKRRTPINREQAFNVKRLINCNACLRDAFSRKAFDTNALQSLRWTFGVGRWTFAS
jgi:hypothetical protein